MGKFLTILEVSRKQDYIFASKKLKENALRSEEISFVTSSDFFIEAAGEWYSEKENLVYAGGGHTILEFPTREEAAAFARQVTRTAMTWRHEVPQGEAQLRKCPLRAEVPLEGKRCRNMEIFVKTMPYDEMKTPGANLKALSAALEKKKALRRASFRRGSFGVEALDSESQLPKLADAKERDKAEPFNPPDGWIYPVQMEELAGADNFVAVIHIDGNAMGKRVDALYDQYGKAEDWDNCRASLRRFSEGIQQDFEAAFSEMVDTVIRCTPNLEEPNLPVRPVILAGDDVCFVTAGNIGLECARVFLEKLSVKRNQEDGKPYAACAGVALVHQKYPFHQAYDLAEELCSNAKRFGAELDANGAVSAMDWHIEFGQLKDSLSELRRDYETEDGNRLELRPVVVLAPEGIDLSVRSYAFFRELCQSMQGEYGKVARGKIKDLRTAFQQGKLESEFFLHDRQIEDLLYHGFEAKNRTAEMQRLKYTELQKEGGELDKDAFVKIGGTERCLFFDAIEMIDHCCFFEEEKNP